MKMRPVRWVATFRRGLMLLAATTGLQCRATALDLLAPEPHPIPHMSTGGAPAGGGGPTLECSDGIATNQPCEFSTQCCSGLCSLDYRAQVTCRPTPGCLGVGRSCLLASECCSLACAANDGGVATCVETSLCSVIGGTCAVNTDCCSNLCDAGICADLSPAPPGPPCATAGDACNGSPDCCGQLCNSNTDESQRCQLLAGCRVQGELCVSAGDCCSGRCSADKSGVSRCVPPSPCAIAVPDVKACTAQVGDICKNSDECCSHVCIESEGVRRCAPAPGCRPACDLCAQNADCCSNNCVADAEGVARCSPVSGCQPEGESCAHDDQCCQSPKSRCVEEPKGLKGKRCVSDAPGPGCMQDGAACALANRCCNGHCLPSPGGGFVCASECVKESEPCTSRADCCDPHADCLAVDGQRVCREMISN